mgnify:CR=1 FL=1
MSNSKPKAASLFKFYLIFVLLGFVLALIYTVTVVIPLIPLKFMKIINAIAIVVSLYLAFKIFSSIFDKAVKIEDPSLKSTVKFLLSLIWYAVIGLAVAASFGIDVSSVILGSAFASIIIGLAAQTVLSNVFAGLTILISKPIKGGKRVTVATWQFGSVFPTYPPKFFSQDILINGITGRISEIRLLYTLIEDDEGAVVAIPNNILLSSSMLRSYKDSIVTTVRFPVKDVDVGIAKEKASEAVKRCPSVISYTVLIDEVYQEWFTLKIVANCKGNRQELCRSEILESLLKEFSKR